MTPGATRDPTLRAWLAEALRRDQGPLGAPPRVALFRHQVVAFHALQRALERFHGAILADDVGLGKTHTALALAWARAPALVIAPARLAPMWRATAERAGLPEGALRVISHAALARAPRVVDAPDGLGLVVVDEAHRFAREHTQRHRALAELGAQAPVLLVSATPVNAELTELAALLRLCAAPGALRVRLGEPVGAWLEAAGRGERDVGALLRTVLVRRPRSIVAPSLPTAQALPKTMTYTLRPVMSAAHHALLASIQRWEAPALGLPAGLGRVLLLERLASSPEALQETLARLRRYARDALSARRRGVALGRVQWRALLRDGGAQQVLPFMFDLGAPDTSAPPDEGALRAAIAALGVLDADLAPWLRAPPKRAALLGLLTCRPRARPTLVFTRYVSTARALQRALAAHMPGRGVALLHGAGGRLGGDVERHSGAMRGLILAGLKRPQGDPRRVDVLVATDTLSEGANLQCCGRVIGYDLTWTPRGLLQRFGRVDRIGGAPNAALVQCVPPGPLERALGQAERVARRGADQARVLGQKHAPVCPTHRGGAIARGFEAAAAAEWRLRSAWVRLGRCVPGAPLPLGWRSRATPRHTPGVLTLWALGVGLPGLWACWVPEGEAGRMCSRAELARRLLSLERLDARPAARCPPRALRVSLALAVAARDRARAASLAPARHRPHTAEARRLRAMSAAQTPGDARAWSRLLEPGAATSQHAQAPLKARAALTLVGFLAWERDEVFSVVR